MIQRPQEDHADLGLIDDDNTEELRKPRAATQGSQMNQPTIKKEVQP
jgi:hypothetical protein